MQTESNKLFSSATGILTHRNELDSHSQKVMVLQSVLCPNGYAEGLDFPEILAVVPQ